MSENILFLGNKIFEIPPFFQTRSGAFSSPEPLGLICNRPVVFMSCLVNMSSDVMWYATQLGHAIYRGSRGIGLEKKLRCSLVFEQNLQF